jgi:hypothetical protein
LLNISNALLINSILIVLGVKYQKLTAFYLISAVCFGPVAVLLIGVEFIKEYFVSLSSIGMVINQGRKQYYTGTQNRTYH